MNITHLITTIFMFVRTCAVRNYGPEPVSIGRVKLGVQDRGQRGSVKTLKFITANDNVEFDYALAA
jgi:hypothetical protein